MVALPGDGPDVECGPGKAQVIFEDPEYPADPDAVPMFFTPCRDCGGGGCWLCGGTGVHETSDPRPDERVSVVYREAGGKWVARLVQTGEGE